MEHDGLAWSGETLRLPVWRWLSLPAKMAGTLRILLTARVGLYPARDTFAPMLVALLLIALTLAGGLSRLPQNHVVLAAGSPGPQALAYGGP